MHKAFPRIALALTLFVLLACSISIPQPVPQNTPFQLPTLPPRPTRTPLPVSTTPILPNAQSQIPTSASSVGSAGGGDPYYPQLGNGGYDAARYTLDLAVDVDANTLSGTVSMEASATQDLSRFNLDFSGPAISGVTIDGKAASFTRQGSELSITPPGLLRHGQRFTSAVTYAGEPGANQDPNTPIYSRGWIPYAGGVVVAAEPSGQSAWFPVNETPADKAAYTFRITVAKPLVAVANGLQKSVTDNGSTRTYLYETDNPVAPYLVTLGIDDFTTETDTSSGVLVRNYFGAGYPDPAREGFKRTPQMITYFESLFGAFPFEAYGVIGHNTRLPFALEVADPDRVRQQLHRRAGGRPRAGSLLVRRQRHHRPLAGYLAQRRLRLVRGAPVAGAHRRQGRRRPGYPRPVRVPGARREQRHPARRSRRPERLRSPGLRPGRDDPHRPAAPRLGDELFFKILKTYAQRFYHANATTADFIALAEEISGQKLADFFQSWLFQVKMPDIPELGLIHP